MQNLDQIWRITYRYSSHDQNSNFRQFKMADGRHFENTFISLFQPWVIRFRSNRMQMWIVIPKMGPFITKIINNSLTIGYIPAAFKKAYNPLVKKPGLDEDKASNFRPVSNLSILSKTLERAVCRQLERHLNSAGLFPSHQSAYRWHHSTETVLLRVCYDITHLDKVSTH